MGFNVSETLKKYWRVLQISKKPTTKKILEILRIVGIGFVIIGLMGFVFYLISTIFGGV